MSKYVVIASFAQHLPGGKEFEAAEGYWGRCCQRCGEALVEDEEESRWTGVAEIISNPCSVKAYYTDGGEFKYFTGEMKWFLEYVQELKEVLRDIVYEEE